MRVNRRDASKLDKVERTPGGGIRIPAVVTRSGVFEYVQPDGTTIHEYRPPDEVARADSLASLRDAPVTYLHPTKPVDPATWRAVSVGHVSGDPKPNSEGVAATVVVNDADTIAKIDGGEAKEISCGYSVEIDNTPGTTPDGMRYDRIQRQITYNHVALGPAEWGRQGSTVSLRLDSAGHQVCNDGDSGVRSDHPMATKTCKDCGLTPREDEHLPWDECMAKAMKEYGDETTARKVCGSIKAANDSKESPMRIKVRVDGKDQETEAGSADHVQLQARADAEHAAALAAETKRADTAAARADTAETKVKELEKTVAELPAKIRADSAARSELETKARAILGADYKFDGKDEKTVRIDAITKVDPEFKDIAPDGKPRSPDYLAARFDGLSTPNQSAELVNKLDRADLREVREDFDADKYVREANESARNAWRIPPTKGDN